MLEDAVFGALIAFGIAIFTTLSGSPAPSSWSRSRSASSTPPSPAVTPTNLLYNLIAIPGALLRFHREGRLTGPLTGLLVLGTLPGMVAGAAIRAELLSGTETFLIVIAAVLVPLGGGLAGAYLGARLQSRLPEALLRRGLGLLALGLGLRYAIQAIG
jgi:uncharacterized membrane protein YfcA